MKLWITWGLSESKRCMEEQKMRRKKQNTANSLICRFPENLASLTEYCLPFIKVGGKFVSYKSVSVDEEIAQSKKAVYVLGGEIGKVEKFHLPGSDMERALVVVEKKRSTPKKYPRKAGMPTKEPLA